MRFVVQYVRQVALTYEGVVEADSAEEAFDKAAEGTWEEAPEVTDRENLGDDAYNWVYPEVKGDDTDQ